MKWITREHAKVDRIACPWLIKNFVDKDAEFLFVPAHKVIQLAKNKTPYHLMFQMQSWDTMVTSVHLMPL
jgi:hypothetical protein